MKKIAIAAVAAALICATGAQARPSFMTPSGKPDAVFVGTNAEAVQGKLANQCMNKGMMVVSNSPGQVVCDLKMGAMQSAFAQMLVGNRYSTPPKRLIRFTIVGIGSDTRVQANSWIETQMAFGQLQQQPIENDELNDGMMGFMIESGGKFPSGTRYRPGTAFLGIEGDGEPRGGGRKAFVVFPVKGFQPASPAKDAGVQVGDVITKVDGLPMKNQQDMIARLTKVMSKSSYDIVVERGGVEQTLTVAALERPPEP